MRLKRSVVVSLMIVLPVVVAAETKQPSGFGKVSFGTPIEDVLKAYPDLRKLGEHENLGASPVGGPYITRYALSEQKIPGLQKPVTVELRFWKDKFWLYVVYFDEADYDAAVAHLKSEYGEPTEKKSTSPLLWMFEKATIMVEAKQHRYVINDNALSNEARLWFVETLTKGRQDQHIEIRTPSYAKSPTPAATQP